MKLKHFIRSVWHHSAGKRVALSLLLLLPMFSWAATVDQQQLDNSGSGFVVTDFPTAANGAHGLDGAQTITVGISGLLSTVALPVWRLGGTAPSSSLVFDVRPTASGVPVENDSLVFATTVMPWALVPASVPSAMGSTVGWTTFNFVPFNVSAGDVLALVLRADRGADPNANFVWNFSTAEDPYPSGSNFLRGSNAGNVAVIPTWSSPAVFTERDRAFATYVTAVPTPPIPEPSTYALMVAGLGIVGFAARRRRKARTA